MNFSINKFKKLSNLNFYPCEESEFYSSENQDEFDFINAPNENIINSCFYSKNSYSPKENKNFEKDFYNFLNEKKKSNDLLFDDESGENKKNIYERMSDQSEISNEEEKKFKYKSSSFKFNFQNKKKSSFNKQITFKDSEEIIKNYDFQHKGSKKISKVSNNSVFNSIKKKSNSQVII